MGKRLDRVAFWVRRRSRWTLIVVGGIVILLLFFNDETSISLNMEYQRELNDLKREIAVNLASARYYREKREAVLAGRDELEHLAREGFNMQRPTEDVYVITKGDK